MTLSEGRASIDRSQMDHHHHPVISERQQIKLLRMMEQQRRQKEEEEELRRAEAAREEATRAGEEDAAVTSAAGPPPLRSPAKKGAKRANKSGEKKEKKTAKTAPHSKKPSSGASSPSKGKRKREDDDAKSDKRARKKEAKKTPTTDDEIVELHKWIQCDKCNKWRRVDSEATPQLLATSETFECSNIPGLHCSSPEEETTEATISYGEVVKAPSHEKEKGSNGSTSPDEEEKEDDRPIAPAVTPSFVKPLIESMHVSGHEEGGSNVPPSPQKQQPFKVGDLVRVFGTGGSDRRDEKMGEVGRIISLDEERGKARVKFVLASAGSRAEIDLANMKHEDERLIGVAIDERFAVCASEEVSPLPESSPPPSSSSSSTAWVRRSMRYAGNDQLSRPAVRELLARLKANDPSLAILRLKHYLEADTNGVVLTEVLDAIERCSCVQALYIQNFEQGMDDERLFHLVRVLERNSRIWALNVGENFRISPEAWKVFAEKLKYTHVTHIYAGSETTVYGDLKVKMRNAVRENRAKHDAHCSPSNVAVISQVGNMWWDPRNAAAVRHLCKHPPSGGETEGVGSCSLPPAGRQGVM